MSNKKIILYLTTTTSINKMELSSFDIELSIRRFLQLSCMGLAGFDIGLIKKITPVY